ACDGAHSTLRQALGLDFVGRVFQDRFLITDVVMQADFPPERWFWFEPPFHDGQSALLHKQPDGVWRIDLQLGADADPEAEIREENVRPRIARMLGPETPFEIEWISLYTFRCRRLERFRHGRVFFAGDAAHQVSPFGARGGNGGVQDADNLAWKLAAVLAGRAPAALLDSYEWERLPAADENILNSSRSTDFMTPKSPAVRDFRDAVLALARTHDFARRMVNSGRLSLPAVLAGSPLNSADAGVFAGAIRPGAVAIDAPVTFADGREGWFLEALGPGFTLMVDAASDADIPEGWADGAFGPDVRLLVVAQPGAAVGAAAVVDRAGRLAVRYDLTPGAAYLFRPDRHVAARARRPTTGWARAAIDRARGKAMAA
ncbi:MAG: FAD-dependent monooxygenase, partial [Alphaproteobacteria bacterium]